MILRVVQLSLLGAMIALFPSCGNMAFSRNFDSSTDPLDSPGSQRRGEASDGGLRYAPGSYVEVTDANAGLYQRFPDEEAQPSLQLAPGTQLKVLKERGSYLKVETESGEIGFVPAIMVSDGAAVSSAALPEGTPVRVTPVDPAGHIPFVAPEPEVAPISAERSEAPLPSPAPMPAPPDE